MACSQERQKGVCRKISIRRAGLSAFSILELIIVISIIIVLLMVSRSLLSGLAGRDSVGNAATELQMLLDFAREQAKSRNSFVWVVFGNGQTLVGGNVLSAVVLGSLDGTSNTASANLAQLSKRLALPDIVLTEVSQLKASTQALLPAPRGINLASQSQFFDYISGGVSHRRFITFSPRGEVLAVANATTADGFVPVVDIGLRKTRGPSSPAPDADDAGIVLFGSSGRSVVIRS